MKSKFFGLIALIAFESSAQDTLKLRLPEAIETVLKNNTELALASLDQQSAIARFHQTNAVFLPQVNLSYASMATDNPLYAFGFKLQQQSVSPSDFNPQLLNSPAVTHNYTTKLEWLQPLVNLDMIRQRKAVEYQLDIAFYTSQRTKEQITFEIEKAYGQLQLAHQAVEALTDALRTVKAVYRSSRNYFEKGYLQKSDLLLAQVKLSSVETRLAEAKSNVSNASDFVSFLMGTKPGVIYSVDSLGPALGAISTEMLPNDRADFKALGSALRAQEAMVGSVRMGSLPKVNAFGNYFLNDKEALGFGSRSFLVGAQLTWNLFNGSTRQHQLHEQRIAHARIEKQLRTRKEQSQLELDKTLRELKDTHFSLEQHEASVKQAAEAFRILQDRFEHGLVSVSELLLAQSTLSEERLLYAEAVFKYNVTQAYLHFLTTTSDN